MLYSENVLIYLKDNASQTIQNHLEENRVPPVSTAAEESKQLLLPRTNRNIKTCFLILSVSLLFIYEVFVTILNCWADLCTF